MCCSATVLHLWFPTSEPCARCLVFFPGPRRSISAESPDYSRLKSRSGAIRAGTNPFQLQRGMKENVRGLELSFKTDFFFFFFSPAPARGGWQGWGRGCCWPLLATFPRLSWHPPWLEKQQTPLLRASFGSFVQHEASDPQLGARAELRSLCSGKSRFASNENFIPFCFFFS